MLYSTENIPSRWSLIPTPSRRASRSHHACDDSLLKPTKHAVVLSTVTFNQPKLGYHQAKRTPKIGQRTRTFLVLDRKTRVSSQNGSASKSFRPWNLKMDWSKYGVWCSSFHPCTLIRTSKQSRAFQKKVAMVTGHFRRGLATFPHFAGCLNHFHQPSIIYPMESTSLGKQLVWAPKKKGLDVPRNQPVTKTKIDSNSAYSIKDLLSHWMFFDRNCG
jgi:hypothetical protein